MCNPLTIGSALLTVGGTAMQMQSQRKAQKAVNAAIQNNSAKNAALRNESQGRVLGSADQFSRDKFDANQADQTGKIKQQLTDALSPGVLPGEYYGGAQGENTKAYTVKKTKDTTDKSMQAADALANLRGFEGGQRVNTQGIQRAGEVVGMNQNKEAGNNAILPIQIEAAKRKGSNPIADLMVGAGGAGLSAGLSGAASGSGILGSQGPVSRMFAGMPSNVQGPVQGFGGWNLV